jgi:Protein of unknown function (DUF3574)
MKYFLAVVLLMMSFVVQTSYAQQPVSLASATEIVETESFIRTELFFGRNKPDGTEVSPEEFADFLSVTITPEFPDGLTVLDGIGQFRDSNKNIIQEKSKVLILLYPSNTRRQSSRKIERIRKVYKERFQQQSVLRVDDILPVKISF